MGKKIFVVYGHHNTKDSFNAEIRNTFCEEAKKIGHEIDLINLLRIFLIILNYRTFFSKN